MADSEIMQGLDDVERELAKFRRDLNHALDRFSQKIDALERRVTRLEVRGE